MRWGRPLGGGVDVDSDRVNRVALASKNGLLVAGEYGVRLSLGDGEPLLTSEGSDGNAYFLRLVLAD